MQVVGIPTCKYIYLFFTPNYLLCKMRKNNENYIFNNIYLIHYYIKFIYQLDMPRINNSIPNELKKNLINLRDAGIDASKKLSTKRKYGSKL